MKRRELLYLIKETKKAADKLRGSMIVVNDTLAPLRNFVCECAERECEMDGDVDDITMDFIELRYELEDFSEDDVMYLEDTLHAMEELAAGMPDGEEESK